MVYHRCWGEDLTYQLGSLASNPESNIYQYKHNFLEVDNVNIKSEFWIFEANYNLVGAFFKNKKDVKIDNATILPVLLSSDSECQEWSDPNGIVLEDDFDLLFNTNSTPESFQAGPKIEGLPQFKQF